jgi:hypothetical protein
MLSTLQQGKVYGTAAIKIYDECCAAFGWDRSQRGEFGMFKLLFAVKADADRKRNVWFICHSNWAGKPGTGGKWNTIRDDGHIVKVEYEYPVTPQACDWNDTIIFAKEKNRGYEFLGVYETVSLEHSKIGVNGRIVYKRISARYPV